MMKKHVLVMLVLPPALLFAGCGKEAPSGLPGAKNAPGDADSEYVLFGGFERSALEASGFPLQFDYEAATGLVHFILPGDRGRMVYTMKKGTATEGEWSFAVSIGGDVLLPDPGTANGYTAISQSDSAWAGKWGYPGFQPDLLANIQPAATFTSLLDSSDGRALEGTSSVHWPHTFFYTQYAEGGVSYDEVNFPTNWSGYSYLRMDILFESADATVRMACEDGVVEPPLEKRFTVPAGSWQTLQIDLDQAVAERGLNLAQMVNFWMFIEATAAATMVYIDNIRLSGSNIPVPLPTPAAGPKAPYPIAPMPQPIETPPDKSILTLQPPVEAPLFGSFDNSDPLALWAYDNNRILLIQGSCLYQTTDGGNSWKTIDGSPAGDWRNAQVVKPGGNTSDPQANTEMDAQGNILLFGNCGGCIYHRAPGLDSTYFRSYVIQGDAGWMQSPFYIVGGGNRGCSPGRVILRLPSGRLWVAAKTAQRFRVDNNGRNTTYYSDDGGTTWRPPGVNGIVTGTLDDILAGGTTAFGSTFMARYNDPFALVSFGDHVACIYVDRRNYRYDWWWTAYDGQSWSPEAMVFADRPAAERNWAKRYRAIGFPGRNDIFLATDVGVLHYDGTTWTMELPGQPALLTTTGGSYGFHTLFAVGPSGGQLMMWEYSFTTGWGTPQVIADEAPVVADMAVPQRSPENFIPVAWNSAGGIKLLRAPISVTVGVDEEGRR